MEDERYVRLYADFENFRKRAARESEEAVRYALRPIALGLLEVSDNLDRALSHLAEETDPNVAAGLIATQKQLAELLARHGIARVDESSFDPEIHEATAYVPSGQAKGSIVSVETPGFTLHGRLIRPARVVVSSGREETRKSA